MEENKSNYSSWLVSPRLELEKFRKDTTSIEVTHLPTALKTLIGRKEEIDTISDLLRQSYGRLLTLRGPGGVGKTRLAIQVLNEVAPNFVDGVCFVSLAPIRKLDLVFPAIAQALGLNEQKNDGPLAHVHNIIQNKHFLLILDNFEHVADAAPQLKMLLAACPYLKILVTSRILLRLLEEQEFYVAPLALPDLAHLPPYEEVAQIEAVSLFLQRVRAACPDFELTGENADIIAQICVRLDGLPLALELAAARIKLFSPQILLARLNCRLVLLTNGARDAPERQQTLRKTLEWSYQLLTPYEQRLFRRLSVFVGECSLNVIEAISQVIDDYDDHFLDAIASLLDQSLLQRQPQAGNEEQRFQMLETIREYALECLHDSDEGELLYQVHAEYYLELAKTLERKAIGGELPIWIERIKCEFENLRVAFDWFLSLQDAERALMMSGGLWPFWLQNHTVEGNLWIQQALERYPQSRTTVLATTRAQAMHTAAILAYYRSNWSQADLYADASLKLYQADCNTFGRARVLVTQGIGAILQGQYPLADAVATESISLLQGAQDTWHLAEAFLVLAYSFYYRGEYLRAYMLGKQGLALSRQTGELFALMRAINAQALFAETQGLNAEIQELYKEGLEITRATIKMGTLSSIAVCLMGMGSIMALQKRYRQAVLLWGKAKTLYKRRDGLSEWGAYRWIVTILSTHLLYAHVIDIVRTQLSEDLFTQLWNKGQTMTLDQLLMESSVPKISTTTQSSTPTKAKALASFADNLTPREREVLYLLTQGLSSALIAKKLVIGLVTVNSHVRTIYSKLGVSSRSSATRYAIEHHLVDSIYDEPA